MLNTLSGMNNAGADCKSLYAPGGVNKGDCSVLYFLFTHLCSARWRSDVVSLKPYSRVYVFSRMKLGGLDHRKHREQSEYTLSASLTKSIFNTPCCCLLRNPKKYRNHGPCGMCNVCVPACAKVCLCALQNNNIYTT